MAVNMLELALDQLAPSDWEPFEKLASQYLVIDFPTIRTMANPSGDGGRDSELFAPEGEPSVCLQYSVAVDWPSKIRRTLDRLETTFPDVRCLVYVTNQQIGAKADDLRKSLLKKSFFLDVRDKTYFLDRQYLDTAREKAAQELVDKIAVPYIKAYDTRKATISPLQSAETRTALTYIGLQVHDDENSKGLTKVCFDALVRAALRDTTSSNPMKRADVHAKVMTALPSADATIVQPLVDACLTRLKRRVITHTSKTDAFFLRQEESTRIRDRVAETALLEGRFKKFVGRICVECLADIGEVDPKDVADLELRVPRIIESLCLTSGEQFVSAVNKGRTDAVQPDKLNTVVLNDIAQHTRKAAIVAHYPQLIQHVIRAIATTENADVRSWLKSLFTSYTLLAFLNQTPDVQQATRKIFSHGKIWLDTTAVLPLFAEQLLEDNRSRVFQSIFEACLNEGDELYVIRGVIDEVHHHMQLCQTCVQYGSQWQGPVPFLLQHYLWSGRPLADFRKWLEEFRGDEDPHADIELYLKNSHGIKRRDLKDETRLVSDDVRFEVDRLWAKSHDNRRHASDYMVSALLKDHDVEMYLGVLGLRNTEAASALGGRTWLLTKDTTAWQIGKTLDEEFPEQKLRSPLLSLSFLLNSIEFSPSRARLNRALEVRLPTILDVEIEEDNYPNIVAIAEQVRAEHEGLPEAMIQRKVRDQLTAARRRTWRQSKEFNDVEEAS